MIYNDYELEENNDDNLSLFNDEEIAPTKKTTATKKNKLVGKHSLNYDIIFKGKKDEPLDDSEDYINDKIKFDVSDVYNEVSEETDEQIELSILKNRIYDILSTESDIIDKYKTRKIPTKDTFNKYYKLIYNRLKNQGYSNCAIFITYSEYFTDNYMNTFKLLTPVYSDMILSELKDRLEFLDDINFV